MKKNDQFWEKRSRKYGTNLSGVMFKSFPPELNQYLHNWQISEIKKAIDKEKSVNVLDIGCGFGRLAKPLSNNFPKARFSGVDISKTYVKLFNNQLGKRGKAKVGSATRLPFAASSFHIAFTVTTFMYLLTEKDQIKAFQELRRVLKPNGKIVLIERTPLGYNFITLGGLIEKLRGQGNKEIPAVSLSLSQIKKYFEQSNFQLEEKSGIPFFTLTLYPLLIAFKINKNLGNILLNLIEGFDLIGKDILTPSLYVSYIGTKKA